MLAAIELILVGITGTLRRDFDQLAIDLVRTVAGVMAMFTLFKYGPDFLQNGVILSFTGWASVAGHVPANAMTPGGVMAQGFNLALILLQAIASGWTVFHPSATLNALLLLFSAIVILVCFAIVACILLETLVEGYVACVAGTALVATSGTRFTWRFGEGYFGWALGVAVKLFFLYLMVGVGTQLAIQWKNSAMNNAGQLMTNWYFGIEAAVEAFLLAVITARIPTRAAQIVDHTVSSTFGRHHPGHDAERRDPRRRQGDPQGARSERQARRPGLQRRAQSGRRRRHARDADVGQDPQRPAQAAGPAQRRRAQSQADHAARRRRGEDPALQPAGAVRPAGAADESAERRR
jgi:P-type conjugative transfer protein TrbL